MTPGRIVHCLCFEVVEITTIHFSSIKFSSESEPDLGAGPAVLQTPAPPPHLNAGSQLPVPPVSTGGSTDQSDQLGGPRSGPQPHQHGTCTHIKKERRDQRLVFPTDMWCEYLIED